MLPIKCSFLRYFSIFLVCWLGVNDAIPYRSHTDEKPANPYAFRKERGSVATENSESVSRLFESIEGSSESESYWSDELLEDASHATSNINNRINVNRLGPFKTGISIKEPLVNQDRSRIPRKRARINNTDSAINPDDKIAYCLDERNNSLQSKKDETVLQECPINKHQSNQVDSRRPLRNGPSIDVEGAFTLAGETEAIKTSSVYTGEDITLCWIELTTIREDSAVSPPKKLVTREYAISFENSDTIPERDMDCSRIRGEILPGDEKTVCETSLNAIIVDDTRRSRVVEFAKDSHDGSINIRQYKKVKCATGSVVSKDIYEWPDGTDNPKKRVEIKVGPSVQTIRSGKDGEPSLCTPKAVFPDSKNGMTSLPVHKCPFGEPCDIGIACEDTGTCNETKISRSCEDGMCDSSSVSEKIPTMTHPPNPDNVMLDDKNINTNVNNFLTIKTVPSQPDTFDYDSCSDYGDCSLEKTKIELDSGSVKDCSQGDCTVESTDSTESIEDCSQGDCTVESSDNTENIKDCSQGDCAAESSGEIPSGETKDSASLCTGDDCTSEEESTTPGKGIITTEDKACQEGSSCEDDGMEKPNSLVAENKVTEKTITLPGNEMTQKPQNDTKCDSESPECSTSSLSSLDVEKTTIATTSISKGTDKQSTVVNIEMSTKRNDVVPTTSPAEKITVSGTSFSPTAMVSSAISVTSAVPLCLDPTSKDCATSVPTPFDVENQLTLGTQESSSTTQKIMPLGTTEENHMTYGTETTVAKEGSSCKEDPTGKNCQSTESNDSINFQSTTVTTEISPQSTIAILLPSSEKPENDTNPVDYPFTPTPITSTVSEIPLINDSTELPENPTVSDEETLINQDSSMDTTSTVLKNFDVTSEPCESSEDCDSTGDTLSSTDSSDSASMDSSAPIESCENATSTNNSDDCEDASSSENCAGNDSSEYINSGELIKEMITSTTETAAEEVEKYSTTVDIVSTTAEPRRTTIQSKLTQDLEGKHRLALKIKVLLEHINEKEEKEKLVQLEKHLLLDEMLDQHGNHSLVWHLKSLNNSSNIERFKSIFNLTDLANLTEVFSHVTDFDGDLKKVSSLKTQDKTEGKSDKTLSRGKRDISGLHKTGDEIKNITDTSKVKAIRDSLPGINEDLKNGLGHVFRQISHELNGPAPSAVEKSVESSTLSIMKILADPGDKRVHSQRRKRATEVEDVSIEELKHPVNGEEIGRWSNERFVMAGDGGRVRSLLEFEIMRDPSDDLRKIDLES